jgi:TldD protein
MDPIRRRELMLGMGAVSLAQLVGCAGGSTGVGGVRPAAAPRPASGLVLHHFAQFGVDQRMLSDALAKALSRGAERADLYFEHRVRTEITLEDGEVNQAKTSVDLGVGVRSVAGDQTGYGYTEELTPESVLRAAATAATIAASQPRTPAGTFAASTLPNRYPARLAWEQVAVGSRIPLLTRIHARALAADPRIKKVSVQMSDEYGAILVVDSAGRVSEDLIPSTTMYVSCSAEDASGRRESNAYNVAGRAGFEFYDDERVERAIREAVARTTILFESAPAPVGEMPVVLAAGASGILLHEAIGHGMEADYNRKNASIYSDRIGRPIARELVSIVDDGTIEHARGALNVDDEGNLAGRTLLVDRGTLATYLHDTISARHYGVQPTGNGRRESFRHVPMPRMRCTYMLPGPHSEEEIIRSIDRGIYCSNFSNGEVQIGAGDFTFYVKNGYLIEAGKLTRPITDVNLIGNGPKALERIDMVADRLLFDEGGWTCGKQGQSVPVSLGMPAVRVASLTVGGGKS